MKRKISLMLAVLMICNLFTGVLSAQAESILEGSYEFIDTAYSPANGGMYLAVAKDFSNASHPAKIYRSMDGIKWENTSTFSDARNYASPKSRQELVWWNDAGVFVFMSGGQLHTSEDGVSWSRKQGLERSNAVIDTDGTQLIVSGGRAWKIIDPEEIDSTVNHGIFYEGGSDQANNSMYAHGVGISPTDENGERTYLTMNSWQTWTGTGDKTVAYPNVKQTSFNHGGTPIETVYNPGEGNWFSLSESGILRKVTKDNAYSTVEVGNEGKVTAVGVGGNYILAGTESGELYAASQADGPNTEIWEPVVSGNEAFPMTDEVRSITADPSGQFIIATKSKIFVANEDPQKGFVYYDVSAAEITMSQGDTQIIVPPVGSSSETHSYTFDVTDFTGTPSEDVVTGISVVESVTGVSTEGMNLIVAPEAAGGEITLRATTVSGVTKDFKILLIREAEVVIEGRDSIAIPTEGNASEIYSAYVMGSNGEKMEGRTATLSVDGQLPENVTFDGATLTVTADAEPAEVTLKAVSDTDPSLTITKTVSIKERSPEYVEITGEDAITSDGAVSSYQYTAKVTDQGGVEMPAYTVKWSLSEAPAGAQISQDGKLTLSGIDTDCKIVIHAECAEVNTVYAEKTIQVTYAAQMDQVPSEGFQLIDSVYSQTLGVYLAVAKTLDAAPQRAEIYRSEDSFHWKKVFATPEGVNAMNPALKRSRQNIVWWESEGVFVAVFGMDVYTSPDGMEWTHQESLTSDKTKETYNVATNGKTLVLGTSRYLDVLNSLDEEPWRITFSTQYEAKIAGLDQSDPPRFVASDQYVTWGITAEGVPSERYPDQGSAPIEMQYAADIDRWLMVNNKNQLRVLTFPNSVGGMTMKLSDGTTNEESLTAVCAGTDAKIVGTQEGKLYLMAGAGELITANTIWSVVSPAEGTEAITEEIGSISQVADGQYLIAALDKLYMLVNRDGEWKYYATAGDSISLPAEQLRVEIPFEGEETLTYQPKALDYKGDPSENPVVDFYPVSEVPAGITFDQGEAYDGIADITVSSEAAKPADDPAVKSMEMEAVFADGLKARCTLTFVKESSVELTVNQELPLTEEGVTESWPVSVAVLANDGKPMDRDAKIKVVSAPEGVSFDPAGMVLNISTQTPGEIVMSACSANDEAIKTEERISLAAVYTKSLAITSGDDVIVIPDAQNTGTHYYYATAYDQVGRVRENAPITWSVSGAEGVTITNRGKLEIPTTLLDSTIKVTAINVENPDVTATKEVQLVMSEYRHASEDAKELNVDLSNLTHNVTLPTSGSWGSEIKWISSDPSVITADGVITRDAKEDTKATLTASVVYTNPETKASAKVEKTFEATVKRADNLFANGDVELGNTTGFASEADLKAVETDVKGGKYALKVSGNSVDVEGNKLEEKSAYYYEAYVKAESGSEIQISSKEYGVLNTAEAENGYTLITGFIHASKNIADDVITIQVKGADEFLVDDVMYIDITEEYDAVTRALSTAESTKKQSDYEKAEALIDAFYDVPEKEELRERLEKIKVEDDDDSGNSRPSYGGGNGGSSRPSTGTNVNTPVVTVPNDPEKQDEIVSDYLLIFKDLKNHWAKDDVEYMAEQGIVTGRSEGVFDPEAPITRAEFAVLISKTMGLGETPYENTFYDVVEEDWYSGYVQSARNAGYVVGSDGLYRPNDNITREEIAKIVVSAYSQKTGSQIETGGALYYNDLEEISSWAYDYIVNAVNLGFVNGISEYSFAPKATATRAQATVMLKRLLDKLTPQEGEEE